MIENNPLQDAGPPLSAEKIAELEAQLGATLPEDYRQFLLESNGGDPAKAGFTVEVGPPPQWMHPRWQAKWPQQQTPWVAWFYRIDERLATPDAEADYTTLAFCRAQEWRMLPADALPIATVVVYDILLLYLRGPRRGEVHLLCDDYLDPHRELTPQDVEAAIRFVAPSFAQFFHGLRATD